MSGNDALAVDGLYVPPEEHTPLVRRLLDIIVGLQQANARLERTVEELKEEIRRLKGLPQKPQRKPSSLEQPAPPGKKKRRRGKRPGSAKRLKTQSLTIDETIPLEPERLPEGQGAELHDYRNFTVQDLIIRSHVVRYRRVRYLIPETGELISAPLPEEVRRHGHFGPGLRTYVLSQYYQNHVTEPRNEGILPLLAAVQMASDHQRPSFHEQTAPGGGDAAGPTTFRFACLVQCQLA